MVEVDRNPALKAAEASFGAGEADRIDREGDLGAGGIDPPVCGRRRLTR